MSAFDQIYQNGPVIAIVRSPSDIWQVLSISDNIKKFGINPPQGSFDFTSYIEKEDIDTITRKTGAAILQKRSTIQMRYRIVAGSHVHWVEDYCTLTYDADGTLTSAGSLLWITTLPLEWHLLSKGSETWNILTSKLRHDMLNQLTAILGYLELSSDMIEDSMLQDFAQKEQNAAEKIREKLIFSREYQKIGQTDFEWVKMSTILTESAGEAGCSGIPLQLNIPDVKIFSDKIFKLAITRVLENIPDHASGVSEIRVSMNKTSDGGILIIEDNGCGIPADQKTRIFDLGYGKGEGNGLFLAQKLLTIYGISISETGTAGSSARFELTIPGVILN